MLRSHPTLLPACAVVLISLSPALAGAAATFDIQNGRLRLPAPIEFLTGSADLAPASEASLKHVQAFLADKPAITLLRIEGHVDSAGAAAQTLSEKRALSVGRWLVGHGVDCKRVIAVGFGNNKPIADASTPEGRAANRRMEIAPAALRGLAIGGMPTDGGGKVAGDLCAR